MKDLWQGKTPLSMASMQLFVMGGLLWVVSGLAIIDTMRGASHNVPDLIVIGIRTGILIFATVAIWRCSRGAQPTYRRLARLMMVLLLVLHAGFLAASLPIMLR